MRRLISVARLRRVRRIHPGRVGYVWNARRVPPLLVVRAVAIYVGRRCISSRTSLMVGGRLLDRRPRRSADCRSTTATRSSSTRSSAISPRRCSWRRPGSTPSLAFFIFRAFDVIKPFPAGYIDEHMPGGAGVVLDDVVSGLYARQPACWRAGCSPDRRRALHGRSRRSAREGSDMRAVILSTGDELTTGRTLDTNANFIADQLVGIGIDVVGDPGRRRLSRAHRLGVAARRLRRPTSSSAPAGSARPPTISPPRPSRRSPGGRCVMDQAVADRIRQMFAAMGRDDAGEQPQAGAVPRGRDDHPERARHGAGLPARDRHRRTARATASCCPACRAR